MRLIDSENINLLLKNMVEKETGAFTKGYNKALKDIKSMINNSEQCPTAYSVDKVVEELEERKALHERLVEYENKNGTVIEKYQHIKAIDVLNDAIEIVKQGSVSDDVCEWHRVKIGNAYKCNTHAEIYDSRVLDWCKCPYCGKKIKVVE